MTTINIKYVGLKKHGERAYQELTGIEWFPGSVHPVGAEHANRLLQHPDVFARASADQPLSAGTAGGTEATGTPEPGTEGSGDPFTDPTFLGTGLEVGRNAVRDKEPEVDLTLAQGLSLAPGATVATATGTPEVPAAPGTNVSGALPLVPPPTAAPAVASGAIQAAPSTAKPDTAALEAMNVDQLRQAVKDFGLSIPGYNLMGEAKLRVAVADGLAGGAQ
jgi:hypothetical protein